MTANKYLGRRIRSWMRTPGFYLQKARKRLLGSDLAFFNNKRDLYPVGSFQWLALTEALYGGLQLGGANSKTNKGGDRMSPCYHDYGKCYEDFLKPFISVSQNKRLTIVEIGILNGNGLAIWCDLFPGARVIGFDIDLSNFKANRLNLERLGAFQKNVPEVYSLDQLNIAQASGILREVLADNLISIVIDDGCHSLESIEITFEAVRPHLNKDFVYFIEDNFDTFDSLAHRHKEFYWTTRGEITVVTNK